MLALPCEADFSDVYIEMSSTKKVNVLMTLKRKEGGKPPSFNWLMPVLLSLFQPER